MPACEFCGKAQQSHGKSCCTNGECKLRWDAKYKHQELTEEISKWVSLKKDFVKFIDGLELYGFVKHGINLLVRIRAYGCLPPAGYIAAAVFEGFYWYCVLSTD